MKATVINTYSVKCLLLVYTPVASFVNKFTPHRAQLLGRVVGEHLQIGKLSRYVSCHPSELSLAIPLYAGSQKTVQICFCQNFIKFPPILIIFGTKIAKDRTMAKRLKLCEMHLFSTSPDLCHHTTMLNADVPNCYTTLKVFICNKFCNDLISTQSTIALPVARFLHSLSQWV